MKTSMSRPVARIEPPEATGGPQTRGIIEAGQSWHRLDWLSGKQKGEPAAPVRSVADTLDGQPVIPLQSAESACAIALGSLSSLYPCAFTNLDILDTFSDDHPIIIP